MWAPWRDKAWGIYAWTLLFCCTWPAIYTNDWSPALSMIFSLQKSDCNLETCKNFSKGRLKRSLLDLAYKLQLAIHGGGLGWLLGHFKKHQWYGFWFTLCCCLSTPLCCWFTLCCWDLIQGGWTATYNLGSPDPQTEYHQMT